MALKLYTHPMSPCAQKVRIVLTEKNLEWQKVHVDLPSKANLEPEYLKLNPLGVVPTLLDDGRPVIRLTFTLTHTSFSRGLGNWLVWENSNKNPSTRRRH